MQSEVSSQERANSYLWRGSMRVGFGEPQGCARSLDSPRPDNDIF